MDVNSTAWQCVLPATDEDGRPTTIAGTPVLARMLQFLNELPDSGSSSSLSSAEDYITDEEAFAAVEAEFQSVHLNGQCHRYGRGAASARAPDRFSRHLAGCPSRRLDMLLLLYCAATLDPTRDAGLFHGASCARAHWLRLGRSIRRRARSIIAVVAELESVARWIQEHVLGKT
jgi:hypothetical protein